MLLNGITVVEAREKFARYVDEKFPTQAAAARHFRVSTSYMSRVLSGDKPPSAVMLTRIGYVRRVVYVENERKA